jgi:hypothetical protein
MGNLHATWHRVTHKNVQNNGGCLSDLFLNACIIHRVRCFIQEDMLKIFTSGGASTRTNKESTNHHQREHK